MRRAGTGLSRRRELSPLVLGRVVAVHLTGFNSSLEVSCALCSVFEGMWRRPLVSPEAERKERTHVGIHLDSLAVIVLPAKEEQMIRDGRGDERCIRTPRRRPFDRFLYPICSGCQLGKGRKIEAPRTVKRTCDFVVLCPFLSELLERSEEVVLFPRFFLLLACEHEIGSVRRARLSPAPWFERGIECWRRELQQKRAGDRPTHPSSS